MAAERFPERQAIIFHELVLTYREVVSMVNCLANGLLQLGLSKGDHLCTFITNRPEYPIFLNAAAFLWHDGIAQGRDAQPSQPDHKPSTAHLFG